MDDLVGCNVCRGPESRYDKKKHLKNAEDVEGRLPHPCIRSLCLPFGSLSTRAGWFSTTLFVADLQASYQQRNTKRPAHTHQTNKTIKGNKKKNCFYFFIEGICRDLFRIELKDFQLKLSATLGFFLILGIGKRNFQIAEFEFEFEFGFAHWFDSVFMPVHFALSLLRREALGRKKTTDCWKKLQNYHPYRTVPYIHYFF